MSKKFFITFTSADNKDHRELEWDVLDHKLAQKWFTEMASAIQNPNKILEQKFSGFLTQEKDKIELAKKLNNAIKIINNHFGDEYQIHENASETMDQDILNRLHHHFELLVGQSWKPAKYILSAPHTVAEQIRFLNEGVHEYERMEKVNAQIANNQSVSRSFECFLHHHEQKPLTEEDLKLFSFEYEPGNLVTSYCQLGKPWFDAYIDQDEHIFFENISPLRYYSSSFLCPLFRINPHQAEEILSNVRKYIRDVSSKNGWQIDSHDPKNALGIATYAKPAKGSPLLKWSEKDRTNFFMQHMRITKFRSASGSMECSRTYL